MRKATRRYVWDRLKVSLWFMPLVMSIAAVLASWLLGLLDALIPNEVFITSKLILTASPNELRAILIGIAGTVLATAGVVFSLLTLPLSTVASQFGSRLLRVFMRDRTTQLVLGMFVATFCYCLATALSIPPVEAQALSPQITVTFALFLMLLTFASLILLIQHISIMLQAPNIVAAAGSDLREAVEVRESAQNRIVQDLSGESTNDLEQQAEQAAYSLRVNKTGYIQFVDPEIILNLASERGLVLRLLRKSGQFVLSGETVALVWPAGSVDEHLAKHLRRGIQIGNQRTPTQDIEYAINQLTEIAVRAMSPAINDPFTALTCLDHLADGLASYIKAGEISPRFYDRVGQLRLFFEPASLQELLGAAFNMLRHASSDNASVLLGMLEAIEAIGQAADADGARQELLRHASLVQAESLAGSLIEEDRQRIYQRYLSVEAILGSIEGR